MNIGHDHDERNDFDAKLRRVHEQAVEHASPRTLRPRSSPRTSPAKPRLQAWPLAATCAIALVAGGLFLRQPAQDAPVEPAVVTATDNNEPGDVYAALDEPPELYVWLASNDTDLVTE
ncbi:MAG TPA: hypothetical protein VGE88_16610 [Lysobacter sp.]